MPLRYRGRTDHERTADDFAAVGGSDMISEVMLYKIPSLNIAVCEITFPSNYHVYQPVLETYRKLCKPLQPRLHGGTPQLFPC